MSIANGIWAVSSVERMATGAHVVCKERLTWQMLVGIVLIALGVLVVEVGSGAH